MKGTPAPRVSRAELARLARGFRPAGATLGLCNGAFDLLHVGHVRYLQDAASRCDFLLVAVNTDASVRASKGPLRPVVPEAERAELVAALACVDAVHLFSEKTVAEVIAAVQPDFHFKGTDYSADSVPEAELVRSLGGRVVIVGDPKDHSTTALAQRLRG
jgi:rfaE bifunctional protein nucleotidyltransferase chain/domain